MKTTIYLLLSLILFSAMAQAQNKTEPNPAAIVDSLKVGFYKNALNAKLSDAKIKELLKIIDERNAVIADFNYKRGRDFAPFSVLDPGVIYGYKMEEAKKLYSKKIKDLLTYEEYFQFVELYFRDEAREKANEEVKPIYDSNPNLKPEQKTSLFDFVYNHYLNYKVTFSYYNGDTTLQKVKQSSLKFVFEMKFAKILKDYNIKAEKMSQSSNNNFQWN